MSEIRELLRDADPIQHEPPPSSDRRDAQRRAVLAASIDERAQAMSAKKSWAPLAIMIAAIIVVSLFLAGRLWSPLVRQVHAAVLFEIRLAEDTPSPGLREVKGDGTSPPIYLHQEVVVTNSDVAVARVIHEGSVYAVGIEFNPAGAKKMRDATGDHAGRPIAILLDGQVVMTPVVRVPIDASAEITDGFTKGEAEQIANGIVAP